MELGEQIKKVADDMMADGTMETIIREQLQKNISKLIDDSLSYGELRDAFKDKIKECMVPAIKNTDISQYVLDLDHILTQVVNETALAENNKILENFGKLMKSTDDEYGKTIKMSTIINAYSEYVANEVDVDGLDVEFDDGPAYEAVEIEGYLEYDEERSWSLFDNAVMDFTVTGKIEDQSDTLNRTIHLSHYKHDKNNVWHIDKVDALSDPTIKSLKYMDSFDILLARLMRCHADIELDEDSFNDEITPNKEPEPHF